MRKILIITDNLPDQINGVVTTYKNIEPYAARDGYSIDFIHPGRYNYIDCPRYNEVKLAYPKGLWKEIDALSPDYIHIATEGPMGLYCRRYFTIRGYRYNTAYHTKFPEAIKKIMHIPEVLTWPIIRWFHSNSNCVLTTTDSMVQQLKSKGFGNNLKAWTRGVDRSLFYPTERKTTDNPVLLNVSRVSKEKNVEVTLCGEIAGDPHFLPLLIGLGVDALSATSTLLPELKFFGRRFTSTEANELRSKIMEMRRPSRIKECLKSFYEERVSELVI